MTPRRWHGATIAANVLVVLTALFGVVAPQGAWGAQPPQPATIDAEPATIDAEPEDGADVVTETTAGAPMPPVVVVADDAAVRQTLLDQRVDTRPSSPGFGGYFRDVGLTVGRTLSRWLTALSPGFARTGRWLAGLDPRWVWFVALILATLAIGRWFASRGRRPSTSGETVPWTPAPQPGPGAAQDRGAAVEAALAAGDAVAALEAVWWWLAERLGHERADGSWTSRELVLRAQRRDLLPMIRRFDGLVYGARRPNSSVVRGFWRDLRGALG